MLAFYTPGCGIIVAAGNVTPSAWHHVLARRSGATVSLWLDGQMTGTGTCADDLTDGAALTFGCVPIDGCAEPFLGIIDDPILTAAATLDPVNDFCAGQALSGADPLPPICLP